VNVHKIIVDTDIIADHLVTETSPSLLRKLMRQYFCYTTVFNAIELFSAARSEKEIQLIDDAMSAMKVLGLNSKSAKNFAKHFSQSKETMTALIAGVCIESKLPIVTLTPNRYKKIKLLEILPAKSLLKIGHSFNY
jgi:predicted nucleic acid-binding protein